MNYDDDPEYTIAPPGVSEEDFCAGELDEAWYWVIYWTERLKDAQKKG